MALYMYVKETLMKYNAKCDSWEKPGKNEMVKFMPVNFGRIKNCPDCDRKRISACKDPTCGRKK
jgi:hypothetical protein